MVRRVLFWGGVLMLALAAAAGLWFRHWTDQPLALSAPRTVVLPPGTSLKDIQAILATQGVIPPDPRFSLLAWITGNAGKLRAGEYRVSPDMTPLDLMGMLVRGQVVLHRITLPEGLTLRQVASRLARGGWVDERSFLALAHDHDFIRNRGLMASSLEGYIFPDTYRLARHEISARGLLVLMVSRFQEIWLQVSRRINMPLPLTRHQVVTMASLVEKETGVTTERPLVARVFFNRLRKGMRLQSDPTVIYGLSDFTGNLTRADLHRPTPYNTYVIRGLPPGPICNPGRAALEAVLHPAASTALYFVARRDGTHTFSSTLGEHNRKVRRFQIRSAPSRPVTP